MGLVDPWLDNITGAHQVGEACLIDQDAVLEA